MERIVRIPVRVKTILNTVHLLDVLVEEVERASHSFCVWSRRISQAKISSTLDIGFHSIGKANMPPGFQNQTSAKVVISIANLLLRNERTDLYVVIQI
jgi:hypothetical protein